MDSCPSRLPSSFSSRDRRCSVSLTSCLTASSDRSISARRDEPVEQPLPLRARLLALPARRLDVQLGPGREGQERAQRLGGAAQLVTPGGERVDGLLGLHLAGADLGQLPVQRLDLAGVRAAEHPGARVVDASPVVLLVPPAGLDLTLAGDRPVGLLQGRHGGHAHVVGAPVQLGREERRETARLERERVDQPQLPVRRGLGLRPHLALGHPQVDEAGAEVLGVHPACHARVVTLRHEQRQPEPAKHPLGGAAPPGVLLNHLDQLTGEGQLVDGHAEALAQTLAQREALARQVAGPAQQARQVGLDLGRPRAQAVSPQPSPRRTRRRAAWRPAGSGRRPAAPRRRVRGTPARPRPRAGRPWSAGRRRCRRRRARSASSAPASLISLSSWASRSPPAAARSLISSRSRRASRSSSPCTASRSALRARSRCSRSSITAASRDDAALGEAQAGRVTMATGGEPLGVQGGVLVAVDEQGVERRELVLRAADGLVRPVEVLEVRHDGRDPPRSRRRARACAYGRTR